MKVYKIYAKPLENNPGDELFYVCSVPAPDKKTALFCAMTTPEIKHFYKPESFIALD